MAYITEIFKDGDGHNVINFRLSLLLNVFAKVFESLIKKQNHHEPNNVHFSMQST